MTAFGQQCESRYEASASSIRFSKAVDGPASDFGLDNLLRDQAHKHQQTGLETRALCAGMTWWRRSSARFSGHHAAAQAV